MSFTNITKWFAGRGRPSSARRVQKSRLQVEVLEGREVPALLGGIAMSMPALPAPQPVKVEVGRREVAGVFQGPTADAIKAAAAATFQYTAVTIKNATSGTLNYSFRWGNGIWTNYVIAPGQQRVHYIRALNQVASIAYDKSFSPGVQEQRYTLPGRNITRREGFYLVEPTPSVGEGRLYTFRSVYNGVQLYS